MAAIPVLVFATLPTMVAIILDSIGMRFLATLIGAVGSASFGWVNAVAENVARVPYATV